MGEGQPFVYVGVFIELRYNSLPTCMRLEFLTLHFGLLKEFGVECQHVFNYALFYIPPILIKIGTQFYLKSHRAMIIGHICDCQPYKTRLKYLITAI